MSPPHSRLWSACLPSCAAGVSSGEAAAWCPHRDRAPARADRRARRPGCARHRHPRHQGRGAGRPAAGQGLHRPRAVRARHSSHGCLSPVRRTVPGQRPGRRRAGHRRPRHPPRRGRPARRGRAAIGWSWAHHRRHVTGSGRRGTSGGRGRGLPRRRTGLRYVHKGRVCPLRWGRQESGRWRRRCPCR